MGGRLLVIGVKEEELDKLYFIANEYGFDNAHELIHYMIDEKIAAYDSVHQSNTLNEQIQSDSPLV